MPWDEGVRWHLEQVEAPDMTLDALSVPFVRDDHLRAANGTAENDYIERLIAVSYQRAERKSWRSILTQDWALVLDRFPCSGAIVLPRPPLQEVLSIEYVDENGDEQTWSGSPQPYIVSRPSGPTAGKAVIRPAYDQLWPTIRYQPDAVTVTYRAGYPEIGSPATSCDIPEDLQHARLLLIGELYKQRSLSVHAFNQNPAIVQADAIFREYRAY
jgi:uncharacterized phiE125 gp8 family phage protein